MENLKYFEIIAQKNELRKTVNSPQLKFKVVGNITTNQLNDIAEYYLLKQGVNGIFETGNFDNIVQDIQKIDNKVNGVIIFWEAANIVNQLHSKIANFTNEEYRQLLAKIKSEIDLIIPKLARIPIVIFNKFSSNIFNINFLKKNKFDYLCEYLNDYIEKKLPQTVFIADIDKIISQISVKKAFNSREYTSSRALYTIDFYKAYTKFIAPVIFSSVGKTKKALIFDCDNTLWKGILGEDGFKGIQMSENDKAGKPFAEVQNLALELNKNGVILGLCSKNNPDDVENVLEKHPDMLLKNKNITIKKINWVNKAQNLREIAKELNIGIDSLVFVDDSDFEINLVKKQIPEITTIKVPEKTHLYPSEIRKIFSLFFKNFITDEDKKKTEQYKSQVKRKELESQANSFNDYLKSLEMSISVHVNDKTIIERMAQMTQKTNQFNLTTKRYTEAQIRNFVEQPDVDVYAISVVDKFGDSGVTGLAIIKNNNTIAEIDTFLMSCRIIGRNIEFKFMDFIIEKIKQSKIKAYYIKTSKNSQTANFFDALGFSLVKSENKIKVYALQKTTYKKQHIDYIKLK